MSTGSGLRPAIGRSLREAGARLRESGSDEIFMRHRSRVTFNGVKPFQTNDTFIAPNATVIGDVTNWDRSVIWYNSVVRADSFHPIEIGFASSIGNGCTVTTVSASQSLLKTGFAPECRIGHYVVVGDGCSLKSCFLDDLVTVGDKCIIGEGAVVESKTILESGTVVPPYARIPSGQVWGGNPAKYVRDLTETEANVQVQKAKCKDIHEIARDHILELLPIGFSYVHLEELEKQAKETEATESP